MNGFNNYSVADPLPGSAVFLEFSSMSEQQWVKVFYKQNPVVIEKVLDIPGK